MTCGIYKITNTANGKVYIGSSVDVRGRFNSHRSDLRQNKHGNQHLQRAWNLYGEHSFVFEIIEECSADSVRFIEQKYLDELFAKSHKDDFYNIYDKASGISSEKAKENNIKRWSDPEFKARASESFRRVWSDPELIARHREACKDNMSKVADLSLWKERQIASHSTDEYIQRSMERTKQQWQDPDLRAKMMASLRSEESRAKKSMASKQAFSDPEFRAKHAEGIRRSLTPERRAEVSKYSKEYFSSKENRDKQRLNSPLRKQIQCNETGTIYESISHAAQEIGASVKSIKKATNPGRTCKGFTFSYVKENT